MSNTTVTIDGPAGSGKGTTARLLAEKLGFHYLDTGSFYRAVGVYLRKNERSFENISSEILSEIRFSISLEGDIEINGENYAHIIRTPEAGEDASILANKKIVQDYVIESGRTIAQSGNYILDGRDTGTTWIPEAKIKFYLTADPEVRAHRRWLDFQQKGKNISETEVLEQILARDHRDMTRPDSPLQKPEGAHEVDTTHLSIDEQVSALYTICQEVLQK